MNNIVLIILLDIILILTVMLLTYRRLYVRTRRRLYPDYKSYYDNALEIWTIAVGIICLAVVVFYIGIALYLHSRQLELQEELVHKLQECAL